MLPQTAKWLNCRKKETIKTDAEAQCGISHLPWPGPSLPTSVPFAQLSFLMVLFPPGILSVLGCLNLLLNQNQNPLNCLLKNKNKTYLCCESVPWLSHQTVKNKPGLFGIYLHMRFPLIPNSTTEEWMRWSQRSRNPGIHNMMPRACIFFFQIPQDDGKTKGTLHRARWGGGNHRISTWKCCLLTENYKLLSQSCPKPSGKVKGLALAQFPTWSRRYNQSIVVYCF